MARRAMADVRELLREFIVCELMGRPEYPLDDDEPLISGGLIDSFALAHIAVFIELTFGVYVPDVELTPESFDTVAQIATRVAAGREDS
jgi:acyl carrier protein